MMYYKMQDVDKKTNKMAGDGKGKGKEGVGRKIRRKRTRKKKKEKRRTRGRKRRRKRKKKKRACRRGETSRISVNLNILAAQSSESMALTVRHPVALKFWKISFGPSMAAGVWMISLSTAKTTLDEPVCAKKCLQRISLLDLASALYYL